MNKLINILNSAEKNHVFGDLVAGEIRRKGRKTRLQMRLE